MSINVVTKGKEGEREVVRALEPIVRRVMEGMGFPVPEGNIIQRNQNQSSVGGCDLANTFGLAIEVKRQETLNVNTWWKQCVESASRNQEMPVLLYRQNNKKWHCVTLMWVALPDGKHVQVRAEMSWEDFLCWFSQWVQVALKRDTNVPRV